MADPAGVQLADEIASHIRDGRLKPGVLVASEQELRSRHDIGRSVLRQAVRILEERGVAYMRRGSGGGLIVAPPDPQSASRALAIVIESRMQGASALDRLLKATDAHVFLAGALRLDYADCQRVRRLAARLTALPIDEFQRIGGVKQLVRAIEGLFQDPLAGLGYQTAAEHGQDFAPYSVVAGVHDARGLWWDTLLQMVEAHVAGDVAGMFNVRLRQQQMMEESQKAWAEMDREPRLVPPIEAAPEAGQGAHSPAERLAREIVRDVRLLGWTPGERIGGAAELMERYHVTVGTLRQAVRILEEHSAVRMERGRNGGLFVTVPDAASAVRRAVDYLEQTEVQPQDARLFQRQLMLETLSGVAEKRPGRAKLAAAAHGDLDGLWRRLGALSEDAALEAFLHLLSVITPPRQCGAPQTLAAMLEALEAGDAPRARRAYLNYDVG